MKKLIRISSIFSVAIIFIILWRCTENPFFKEDVIIKKTIRGKVELSDQMTPNDVYVWLQGFDISARSDENGLFEITLPSPANQPGGGLDGVFNLYFYVANYQLDSAKVVVHNGNVEYSKGDLNEKGELYKTQHLFKLLDISFSTSPDSIKANYADTIIVSLALQTILDSVTVVIPKMRKYPTREKKKFILSVAFFKKVDSDENFVKTIDIGGDITGSCKVRNACLEYCLEFCHEPGMLPAGEYEVIPYLLIQQKNIPPGLMNSLGENVEGFSADYLNIPLKVENNKFRVELGEK